MLFNTAYTTLKKKGSDEHHFCHKYSTDEHFKGPWTPLKVFMGTKKGAVFVAKLGCSSEPFFLRVYIRCKFTPFQSIEGKKRYEIRSAQPGL